jgi:ketosteroid isomerase-like protein
MLVALALAAAAPATTAIDAERAFAADAQKAGQWTAFRKYAAPDALMFTPQPVKAHDFLKDRRDPPTSVFWWPGASYVSCDGKTAINTGPWVREGGKSVGYFTTVWKRQPDGGWKWVYDAGDTLKTARAQGGDIKPVTASCAALAPPPRGLHDYSPVMKVGGGRSGDSTLVWNWHVMADGARGFRAYLWTGRAMQMVIDDQVAAPPK